jgi:hypothetical protein
VAARGKQNTTPKVMKVKGRLRGKEKGKRQRKGG